MKTLEFFKQNISSPRRYKECLHPFSTFIIAFRRQFHAYRKPPLPLTSSSPVAAVIPFINCTESVKPWKRALFFSHVNERALLKQICCRASRRGVFAFRHYSQLLLAVSWGLRQRRGAGQAEGIAQAYGCRRRSFLVHHARRSRTLIASHSSPPRFNRRRSFLRFSLISSAAKGA